MEIRFVGSGDAFGSGGRFQTCIRLQEHGYTTLVDCGATTLTAMKAQDLDPGEVDAVVLSHLHGDHFGGLPFLVLDGQFTRRTKALTVLGPVGTTTFQVHPAEHADRATGEPPTATLGRSHLGVGDGPWPSQMTIVNRDDPGCPVPVVQSPRLPFLTRLVVGAWRGFDTGVSCRLAPGGVEVVGGSVSCPDVQLVGGGDGTGEVVLRLGDSTVPVWLLRA